MSRTRNKTAIYLIGSTADSITGSRLPSNLQILQVFFHFHSNLKLSIRESSAKAVEIVEKFWEKANIPTRPTHHAIKKLEDLHKKWIKIKKNKTRRSAAQMEKEAEFTECFPKLFDIAHQDAMKKIKIQEDIDFLVAQRQNRQGCMVGVDLKKLKIDIRKDQRIENIQNRVRKEKMKKRKLEENVQSQADSSTDEEIYAKMDETAGPSVYERKSRSVTRKRRKGKRNIITPELASALDRSKVTDRMAVHVVAATAAGLELNVSNLNISRTSIRKARQQNRINTAQEVKTGFKVEGPLTVHWDGKLLPDLTGHTKVDRLPIFVTGNGTEQLLSVPKLINGTGQVTSDAVMCTLEDWGIQNRVIGMAFDTTSSNTGKKLGCCTLLEEKMGRKLLHFACRHHVLEIVLEKVFTVCLGISSSGPEILLFKLFKANWHSIDKTMYRTLANDETLSRELSKEKRQEVLSFSREKLKEMQPREDYEELLKLTIIFLSGIPPGGIRFRAPGAIHRARWMAKLIFAFKVYMFGRLEGEGVFKLTRKEEHGLRELICFAIGGGYIQAWISAPLPISAPMNDLKFVDLLMKYSSISKTVSDCALEKFSRHLWYLGEDMIALAFFDESIPYEEKRAMVKAMKVVKGTKSNVNQISANDLMTYYNKINAFATTGASTVAPPSLTMRPSFLVTQNTRKFFTAFGIKTDFLSKDPEIWPSDCNYLSAKKMIGKQKVVNDIAERGVALMQDFNDLLTSKEDQKQYLLQVVSEHRKRFPDAKKSTILSGVKHMC